MALNVGIPLRVFVPHIDTFATNLTDYTQALISYKSIDAIQVCSKLTQVLGSYTPLYECTKRNRHQGMRINGLKSPAFVRQIKIKPHAGLDNVYVNVIRCDAVTQSFLKSKY